MASDNSKKRVKFYSHAIKKEDLRPGDHIYAYRKFAFYFHHGIYQGDQGEHEVIHFSGVEKDKTTAAIQGCSLEEFLAGSSLRLVAYDVGKITRMIKRFGSCHCSESRSASDVIQTATEYLHNPDKWGRYNLINRNCEHFAVFCKTKQLASGQVGRTLGGFKSIRRRASYKTMSTGE